MKKIAGVVVLLVAAGATLHCRSRQETAQTSASTQPVDEASRRDHEISISNLKVSTIAAGAEYELAVDVLDAKGDLKPDTKAVAKYQIVCPGGTAHAVLSEPARVSVTADGRTTVRHRVSLADVKKGTEPCQIRFAVGHRYDFLSNELQDVLPAR